MEASITAKPFFERMEFLVVQKQKVTRRGETFVNYAMEKFPVDRVWSAQVLSPENLP